MENPFDLPETEINYRDNGIRASRIILIFRITIFFYTLVIAAYFYLIKETGSDYSKLYTDKNLILIQSLIFFINYPLILIMIIFFLQWFQRSYFNLHQTRGIKPLFKTVWALIGWFIPFINLVVPFLIMHEIVLKNATINKTGLKTRGYTFKIIAWWLFYIFGTYVSAVMGIRAIISPNQMIPTLILKWNMIFISALIISLFIVISLIQQINKCETELRESQQ